MDINNFLAKKNKTIEQHNNDLIYRLNNLIELNYIKDENIRSLLYICCKYHDYGKCNSEFQKRILYDNIKFNSKYEIAHNILSMFFINKDLFINDNDYYISQFAVGFHHNYCDVFETIENNKTLINKLLTGFDTFNIRTRKLMKGINGIKFSKDAIIVKGLLHKCDYCASGEIEIEYRNNFLNNSMINILSEWRKTDKTSNWNRLQLFCKENSNKNIIAIASTGSGKTEASLHWIGDNKGFFVLPLRTAINSMYNRIKEQILNNDTYNKLGLLHSESVEYLLNSDEENIDDIMDLNTYTKNLTIPLTISTMDQLFDFVFRYPSYELKLATFSYSKIVIDEIQSYDAELLAYLIYGLEQIYKVGGKIMITTATLMPFVKDKLKEIIPFEETTYINDIKRHNVKVIDDYINSKNIINKYNENLNNNSRNKILVVCNTIKKAQELYEEIKCTGIDNVRILHSRFTKNDRRKLENDIMNFARSKKILEEPQNGIWISTSVVEASLDLDFDYLFTELQDLNSLFQRLGRCNRLGLKSTYFVNCYVYLNISSNLIGTMIDKIIYELSREQLLEFKKDNNETVLTEQQKIDMLECFNTERMNNSDYMNKYNEIYNMLGFIRESDKKQELRHILSKDIIPKNVYLDNKELINNSLEIIHNKKSSVIDKIKSKTDVKNLTVSIQYYQYKKQSNDDEIEIVINHFDKIPVVNCNYNDKGVYF